MRILIAKIGEDKKDPLVQIGSDYLERMRHPYQVSVKSLKEKSRTQHANDAVIIAEEGQAILAATKGHRLVALHDSGKSFSSEAFSTWLHQQFDQGYDVAFAIGGATGISDEVRKSAVLTLSLSAMTLPHRLAFCVLCEQIYRACEIKRGSPYHK